jgi:hypothetical protein
MPLIAFVLACLMGLALPAQAADLVVDRAWLEDRTGQMSWAEAQRQPTQPVQDVLSAGYGTHPVWLRLRIDPAAAGLSRWDVSSATRAGRALPDVAWVGLPSPAARYSKPLRSCSMRSLAASVCPMRISG